MQRFLQMDYDSLMQLTVPILLSYCLNRAAERQPRSCDRSAFDIDLVGTQSAPARLVCYGA